MTSPGRRLATDEICRMAFCSSKRVAAALVYRCMVSGVKLPSRRHACAAMYSGLHSTLSLLVASFYACVYGLR